MKFKGLLQFIVVAIMGQFLFSCSSAEYYRFTSAKPETYQKAVAKTQTVNAPQESAPAAPVQIVTPAEESPLATPVAEPVLEASTKAPEPVLFETKKATIENKIVKAETPEVNMTESVLLETAKNRLATMSKAEKKEFKKEVKNALRGTNEASDVVKIILSFLLPPLAVFLHEGVGNRFWISLLLTILLWVPGIIYALLVVTDTI